MARKHDGGRKPPAESAEDVPGTLADAIAAHLELKKEHGADPDTIEQERQSALAPARRDLGADPGLHAAPPSPPEPIARPEPSVEATSEIEPAPPVEPDLPAQETVAFEPPVAEQPSQAAEPPQPEPVLPTEDTGNFEFDWDGESEEQPPAEPAETTEPHPADADVLEQTPEFFEETPEYDRLWFEERPPRDFDF